jgi:hypothetical protein
VVTIDPAPLTISASSGSMTYGGTPPAIIPNYSGFMNGDTPLSLSVHPTCSTTATSSDPPSPPTYPSSCSGAADPNYTISYVPGTVTVNPAPIYVTVSGGQTYGSTTPSFSGTDTPPTGVTVNTSGLSCTEVGTSTPISPTLPAGSDTLVANSCSGATLSGPNSTDYAAVYTSGAGGFTVNPAPLTITASSPTSTYGTTPVVTPLYSGFKNGDSASSLSVPPTCVTTATSSSPPSPPTYPSSCSGASDSNYTISYAPGVVTVIDAPIDVAVSGSQTYGATPSFSGTDTPPTGVTVNASGLSCTEVGTSTPIGPALSAGSHTLVPSSCSGATISGADATDYAISYTSVAKDFTVNPAPLTITASSATMNQGATVPAITPIYSGFKNGDSASSLSVQPVCSTTATSSSAPSPPTYPTSCSGAADPNYAISYVPGAVTVNDPPPTPPTPPAPTHGYWLVGSDGGIFTFGSASFYGSTGSLKLQRPVVGITPTKDRGGYWLVASDGGTFAFGDAGFYGSVPGLGLNPAGSGLPHSLNAPIVGMVPAADGQGYFVVASDGGVFAFGPGASFAGSCPGIGGCSGPAVSVIPDSSGNGYWLFTATGNVYTFGDAPYLGTPGNVGSPVTSAVRTPDGKGYWVLVANGTVYGYGDALNYGSPGGQLGGPNPATAVFTTSDGGGYWVVSAAGAVDPYGDAPNDGGMAGTKLNGAIIAATGF